MGVPAVGGYKVKADYIPNLYSPVLQAKAYDNTFLSRVTNKEYEGQLRQAGDQITIRKRPDIKTGKYIKGMNVPVQSYATESIIFPVERSRYYAFDVNDLDKALSDIKTWVTDWTNDGAKALSLDNEREFLADIAGRCAAANQGNAAGIQSGVFNLGSVGTPLALYGPPQTTANKSAAVDAIAAAIAVLEEQPGGVEGTPWVIMPVWVAHLIQTSELKSASVAGDATSLLRKNVLAMGSIAGADIYVSNLIPKDYNTNATNNVSWNIVFGDNRAITYAQQVSTTEMVRKESDFGTVHRSLMVYDWFPVMPERFGVMTVHVGS